VSCLSLCGVSRVGVVQQPAFCKLPGSIFRYDQVMQMMIPSPIRQNVYGSNGAYQVGTTRAVYVWLRAVCYELPVVWRTSRLYASQVRSRVDS
jgi:hypothetical protein